MKRALPLLLLLSACATVTAKTEQEIHVTTEPAGASCSAANQVGEWDIPETPASVTVKRSFSPLTIYCHDKNSSAKQVLEPRTRGRAYGNILLFGFPAFVDASTGAGYEYDEAITLELKN